MGEISLEILKTLSEKHGKFISFQGGTHNYTTGETEWIQLTFEDGANLFFDYVLYEVDYYLSDEPALPTELYQLKVDQHKIIEWYNIINTGITGE